MIRGHDSYACVAVIIPALNEESALRELLPILHDFELGRLIVADNGSTDGTARVAREHGATVVSEPRRGYGAACQAGISVLDDRTQVVLFLDADLSDDPTRLPDLLDPILNGDADMTIGARLAELREPGAMTLPQRFGNGLAVRLIRAGWGHRYQDLGPFRAIRASSLRRIGMRDRAFGWTIEMQIRAVEERLRIIEIPLAYRRRKGVSKISGTLRGVVLAGYWILTTWARLWFSKSSRRAHRSI